MKFCKYNEKKVEVNLSGANDFSVKKNNISILDKFNLTSRKYLFAVGSMNPNKNFRALLEAIKLLNLGDCKFVISGGINSKIFQSQAIEDIPKSVIFTGYVSDDELNSLYANALCFVFPSIYEGFGFPPLEAMSVGCPVIVSNAASLPEVCSDAALYCNPYDVSDIASKIQFMIDNPKLQIIYSNKGYARVKDLDWKSTVAEVIKLF
jgi:glycosyltransferase involved in cell wall biosynthesis